jgi:hypothetical protein
VNTSKRVLDRSNSRNNRAPVLEGYGLRPVLTAYRRGWLQPLRDAVRPSNHPNSPYQTPTPKQNCHPDRSGGTCCFLIHCAMQQEAPPSASGRQINRKPLIQARLSTRSFPWRDGLSTVPCDRELLTISVNGASEAAHAGSTSEIPRRIYQFC